MMNKPLVAMLLAMSVGPGTSAGDSWGTDYAKAIEAAKKAGKPVLVDFTGSDWCGWCIKLKKEVFDTPEFGRWAKDNVVLLELDFPRKKAQSDELKQQNQELQQKFGIRGFPTILFLAADGSELGRSGYLPGGPEAWVKDAEEKLAASQQTDAAAAEDTAWLTSFDKAREQAKSQNRLILADFTGSDWCSWCIKLKKEVFDTPEFQAWAKDNVVLLEVDFPNKGKQSDELKAQNRELAEKYAIEGYPTILLLDADGERKGELGYKAGGPTVWLKDAEQITGDHAKGHGKPRKIL